MSRPPQVAQNWADDDDDTIEASTIIDDGSTVISSRQTNNTKGGNKAPISTTTTTLNKNSNNKNNTKKQNESSGDDDDSSSDDDDDDEEDEEDVDSDDMSGGARSEDEEDEEDEDFDEDAPLPEYSCRYCRRCDPLSAVKCGVCKKWFCNTSEGTSGSHIVMHLAKCKHREVTLHADSALGDAPLECFVCGTKNVFLLGFLPSKEEDQMVLICREPCLNSKSVLEMEWDPNAWASIIEERQLLHWIAATKTAKKKNSHVRPIGIRQIDRLEEMWKVDPNADLDTVLPGRAAETLEHIPVDFVDPEHYERVFSQHIEAESLTDKEQKEKNSFENLTVRWGHSVMGRRQVHTEIPTSDNILRISDDVTLVHPETGFECQMSVTLITPSASMTDELRLEALVGFKGDPPPSSGGYIIRCRWNKAPFERMAKALRTFQNEEYSISNFLFEKILGFKDIEEPKVNKSDTEKIPTDLNAPGLPPLNPSQRIAVRKVLTTPLSLIQGPPGTGKTTTCATIVHHLCKMHTGNQVLVCAPSNVAVDHLTETIAKTGLNVVRVVAKSREAISTATDKYALHNLVRDFCNNAHRFSELSKLFKLRDTTGALNDSDKRRFAKLAGDVERLIIEEADVICATCVSVADHRLTSYRFKYCLIDECTHAQEPECLIPLVTGVKQCILVGDHCQMRPTVLSKAADDAGLGRSLFERLVILGNEPVRLEIQYRMHPCLSEFSSNTFYEGALQNGVSAEERNSSRVFPWPDPHRPSLFYHSLAPEEMGPSGTSYLNRAEAAIAEKIVTRLLKSGEVTPDQIGVITPYEAQRCFLVNYMARNGTMPQESYKKIEVESVDSFQGREKEYIILTCVRSNSQQGIGFLADWRRLNVALTRAKKGLFIVGNARILATHFMWHRLLSQYKENNLIVNGSVENATLQSVDVVLPKPRIDRATAELLVKGRSGASYLPAFMSDQSITEMAASVYNAREGGAPVLLPGQTIMPPTNPHFHQITQQQMQHLMSREAQMMNAFSQQQQMMQMQQQYQASATSASASNFNAQNYFAAYDYQQQYQYVPGQAYHHMQHMNQNGQQHGTSYQGSTTDGTGTEYY